MADRLDYDPGGLGDDEAQSRRRRGPSTALIVALAVVLVAGLWIGHRLMQRGGGAGTIPIIHADTRPIKIKPTDPGGMDVPDQDMQILNPQKGASKVEQLLPPPETPLPRPAPVAPPPAPAQTQAQTAETPPPAAVQAQPISPPVPAAAPTVTNPAPAQAPAAAPAPAQTQAPAPAQTGTKEAAAPAGGIRLQLGALRTSEAAKQEWERLKHTHADLLGGLSFSTARVDLGERGVYYRILAGPVADAAQADHICAELKQRKLGCILVKP